MPSKYLYAIFLSCFLSIAHGQTYSGLWHGKERTLHYRPAGIGFEKVSGAMRFNRALYGTNTGFRVEAGDLPEFALYLPGMGGNFKLGLIAGEESKWITDAAEIKTEYSAGRMRYFIRDSILGKGFIFLSVLAMPDTEGMILEARFANVTRPVSLVWVYGGVTGKRFSRDGDIGADPESSFYLQPEYCQGNTITINRNTFQLTFGANGERLISGITPLFGKMHVADAMQQQDPLTLWRSRASATPVVTGMVSISETAYYFLIQPGASPVSPGTDTLVTVFSKAERGTVPQHNIRVGTPDKYINEMGSALRVAADAIWEHPSYLHGAVAWRMRLPAWRGAYAADLLGWHDRARTHFSSYALSQVKEPESAPVVMDTSRNLARHLEKIGTGMFTSGYICRNPNGDIRPHHYDMNLVFIDQLLNHFYWTGDTAYIREMWPVIERHLAWEKRNFDTDNDGLYDAYCCIWASDALQYSGGGVTHSSAYNYRANKTVAELATFIGKDGTRYRREAEKIRQAIQQQLWLPTLGRFAEYRDLLGRKLVHPVPGLWTLYHAMDAGVPDAFQAYQALRYIDTEIPHIPVKAKGLEEDSLYLLSTTNWQPYTWSVNNVALAENLHTALAYWQGNRPEEAFRLWKSALVESMYLGASPGGFQQLSFYDAIRGQLYRDFADPVGVAARSLVEGLFGIRPDLLNDTLTIQPGFPASWRLASLDIPDVKVDFNATTTHDRYVIHHNFERPLHLKFSVRIYKTGIKRVLVNGRRAPWRMVKDAVGGPMLEITTGKSTGYRIHIYYEGNAPEIIHAKKMYASGDTLQLSSTNAIIKSLYDPQGILENRQVLQKQLTAVVRNGRGERTVFVQLQQGKCTWWQPVNFKVVDPVQITPLIAAGKNTISFTISSVSGPVKGAVTINWQSIPGNVLGTPGNSAVITRTVSYSLLRPGTNRIRFVSENKIIAQCDILNWDVKARPYTDFEKIDLAPYFNDKVTNIFKHEYLSPRPQSPTLQLPTQGIGNWCYPLVTATIDDSGLRKHAAPGNEIVLPQGIPFATPADSNRNNIIFTSQWDNFPESATIPLSGKAAHLYMMMAGTTNPMQSRLVNGIVRVQYADGSEDTLSLYNPVNWWPIEQDYLDDGFAFTTDGYKPLRFYLKKGVASTSWNDYTTIRGFSNRAIDGGAATILDLPLDRNKELHSLTLEAVANDVVIGLMSVTIER